MPNVLAVTAFEIRNPVPLLIPVKAHDSSIHEVGIAGSGNRSC
jgi:hypothetical protein